jgi:succinyl-CoA synthetase beta subunit
MSRVPITEYRAKSILLPDLYLGTSVGKRDNFTLDPNTQYVIKVDQGVKKRMKQGLIRINCDQVEATEALEEWKEKGFSQFLIEPLVVHNEQEERYIMAERVRQGVRFVYCTLGGIEVESHKDSMQEQVVVTEIELRSLASSWQLPEDLLRILYQHIAAGTFAFIEINPCVVRDHTWIPLDAAALVDSCSSSNLWQTSDIPRKLQHEEEVTVEELQKTTAASLKLKVMNRDGSFFLLLSGGGGSLVVLDALAEAGQASQIGNYGEYSGNPTEEETYLYTKQIIKLLLESKAERKLLFVAGGIANFTNIANTFSGVIAALQESSDELKKQDVRVVVRRGGPNEEEGLRKMKTFLQEMGIHGVVMGSEKTLMEATAIALESMNSKNKTL